MRFNNTKMADDSGNEYEAFQPPRPMIGKLPGWIKERVRLKFMERRRDYLHWEHDVVLELAGDELSESDWLDHWGTSRYGGKEFFISEPYTLTPARIETILKFCRLLDCDFSVQPASYHYPTQTLRVMIWPQEWDLEPDFLQVVKGYDISQRQKGFLDRNSISTQASN